jgi:PPIC-type PPIASE domain
MRAMTKIRLGRLGWKKIALALGCAGVVTVGLVWGRPWDGNETPAPGPATPPAAAGPAVALVTDNRPPSEYFRQAAATLNGNVVITYEDLGKYLIDRYGADKLQHLISWRIIEAACRERGITVTEREIDADLEENLKELKVNRQDFIDKVLKHYGKTLYEWREDVIRPKLMMTKYCQDRVRVTDEDLDRAYKAYYGPKVHCQLILWPEGEQSVALKMFEEIHKDPEVFDHVARMQANPRLAATAGLVEPFGWNTMGNEELEKIAFSLKPGEISQLIGTPEGTVLLKCREQIQARTDVKPEDVRAKFEKEIRAKLVQIEIPKAFAELKKKADPTPFLKNGTTDKDIRKNTEELLQTGIEKTGSLLKGN